MNASNFILIIYKLLFFVYHHSYLTNLFINFFQLVFFIFQNQIKIKFNLMIFFIKYWTEQIHWALELGPEELSKGYSRKNFLRISSN